nr:MAG TPA: hypothetical protein [Crassvirales sp.]DAN01165.1 MAG TPA: hypothetical protein [Crassvirales sp.]
MYEPTYMGKGTGKSYYRGIPRTGQVKCMFNW